MADPEAGDDGRARFAGSIADLAETLEPYVTKLKFLSYTEKLEGPVERKVIVAQQDMLNALRTLQPNLAFPQEKTRDAFKVLAAGKNTIWQLTDSQLEDWSSTMARRTRAMCRHLQQALTKNVTKPKWLMAMAWVVELDSEEVAAKQDAPTTKKTKKEPAMKQEASGGSAPSQEWRYDWDSEHEKAFRVDAKGQKLWAENIVVADDAEPTDPIMASFGDGSQVPIKSMTVETYTELVKSAATRNDRKKAETLFDHTTADEVRYHMSTKKDRNPLMVLFEDGKQILAVRIDLFENDPVAAAAFLQPMTDKFLAGELLRTDLKKAKTDALKELKKEDAKVARRDAKKRPAAAAPEDLEQKAPKASKKRPASTVPEDVAAAKLDDKPDLKKDDDVLSDISEIDAPPPASIFDALESIPWAT